MKLQLLIVFFRRQKNQYQQCLCQYLSSADSRFVFNRAVSFQPLLFYVPWNCNALGYYGKFCFSHETKDRKNLSV